MYLEVASVCVGIVSSSGSLKLSRGLQKFFTRFRFVFGDEALWARTLELRSRVRGLGFTGLGLRGVGFELFSFWGWGLLLQD